MQFGLGILGMLTAIAAFALAFGILARVRGGQGGLRRFLGALARIDPITGNVVVIAAIVIGVLAVVFSILTSRLILEGHGVNVAGVVSWGAANSGMPPLELKSLYVGQSHRGTGLAAALTARAIGDRPAQLWVFEGNPRAQKFYRKLGFSPDGTCRIDPDTTLWEIRFTRKAEPG